MENEINRKVYRGRNSSDRKIIIFISPGKHIYRLITKQIFFNNRPQLVLPNILTVISVEDLIEKEEFYKPWL